MKKIIASLMTATMIMGMAGCSTKQTTGSNASAKMKAGTYTASKNGMNDMVEVSVEVAEDKIVKVEVTKHSETAGIGGELKDKDGKVLTNAGKTPVTLIPEEIVKHQSIKVDNVTGATITSAAVKSAVKDCLEQAGANIEEWEKEVTYEAPKDVETDVVVIGGGGSGMAAALSAAQAGKNVVVVEKAGSIGGDTLVCGAIYNAPNEELQSKVEMSESVKKTIEKALAEEPVSEEHKALQAEVKAQWDEYNAKGRTDLFDSKEWYALQTWINGDKVGSLDLVKVLCFNSYPGLEWIQSMGMNFNDKIAQGAGSLWQRTHTSTMKMGTGFLSVYAEQLEKLSDKITLMVETSATGIMVENDTATGIKAKDNHSGTEFTVKAKDGVILASGGFGANSKMVQEYNTTGKWPDLSKVGTTNRFSASQGDGITMAKEAGASLTDMDQIQLLYLGNVVDGQISKFTARCANGTDQIVFINKEGKRFVREDGRRDEICLGVLDQTDAMFYVLESADGAGYKDIKDPEWRSADGFTFQYLVDNGFIFVDDTLEGLAKQLGMEPETLKATVDEFNKSVDAASDEFGRLLYTTKLEHGPWTALPRQACIHHTMGGVTIDTNTHILNDEGKAIKGLYAAGEVVGGIHGANRLGGNAVVDTVVFGKLAGDTIVADTK